MLTILGVLCLLIAAYFYEDDFLLAGITFTVIGVSCLLGNYYVISHQKPYTELRQNNGYVKEYVCFPTPFTINDSCILIESKKLYVSEGGDTF